MHHFQFSAYKYFLPHAKVENHSCPASCCWTDTGLHHAVQSQSIATDQAHASSGIQFLHHFGNAQNAALIRQHPQCTDMQHAWPDDLSFCHRANCNMCCAQHTAGAYVCASMHSAEACAMIWHNACSLLTWMCSCRDATFIHNEGE